MIKNLKSPLKQEWDWTGIGDEDKKIAQNLINNGMIPIEVPDHAWVEHGSAYWEDEKTGRILSAFYDMHDLSPTGAWSPESNFIALDAFVYGRTMEEQETWVKQQEQLKKEEEELAIKLEEEKKKKEEEKILKDLEETEDILNQIRTGEASNGAYEMGPLERQLWSDMFSGIQVSEKDFDDARQADRDTYHEWKNPKKSNESKSLDDQVTYIPHLPDVTVEISEELIERGDAVFVGPLADKDGIDNDLDGEIDEPGETLIMTYEELYADFDPYEDININSENAGHVYTYLRGLKNEEIKKKTKEDLKTQGAINLGFNSTPEDHYRADMNPDIPTVILSRDDFVIYDGDGALDYETTLEEAQSSPDIYEIKLKDWKYNENGLLVPVDMSSFQNRLSEIESSDKDKDEKDKDIERLIKDYDEFIRLEPYTTGELNEKVKKDKERYNDYIDGKIDSEIIKEEGLDNKFYSPKLGFMTAEEFVFRLETSGYPKNKNGRERFINEYFIKTPKEIKEAKIQRASEIIEKESYETLLDITQKKSTPVGEIYRVLTDPNGYFRKYNLAVNAVDDSGYDAVRIYIPTIKYMMLDADIYGGESFYEGYSHLDNYNEDRGILEIFKNEGGQIDFSEQQLRHLFALLDKQIKDPRGNIPLLNSLFHDEVGEKIDYDYNPAKERKTTLDNSLRILFAQQNKMRDMITGGYWTEEDWKDWVKTDSRQVAIRKEIQEELDNDFNYYFKDAGLQLHFTDNKLKLSRTDGMFMYDAKGTKLPYGSSHIYFEHTMESESKAVGGLSTDVISYLAHFITKKEMQTFETKAVKYQNGKLIDPLKERAEEIEKEISINDYTEKQVMQRFFKNREITLDFSTAETKYSKYDVPITGGTFELPEIEINTGFLNIFKDKDDPSKSELPSVTTQKTKAGVSIIVPGVSTVDGMKFLSGNFTNSDWVPKEIQDIGNNAAQYTLQYFSDALMEEGINPFAVVGSKEDLIDYLKTNMFKGRGGASFTGRGALTDEQGDLAWTWYKAIYNEYLNDAYGIRETMYTEDFVKKLQTYAQSQIENKDYLLTTDNGDLYIDRDGNELILSDDEIQADINKRLDINTDLLDRASETTMVALQDCFKNGFHVDISFTEDGEIIFNGIIKIDPEKYDEYNKLKQDQKLGEYDLVEEGIGTLVETDEAFAEAPLAQQLWEGLKLGKKPAVEYGFEVGGVPITTDVFTVIDGKAYTESEWSKLIVEHDKWKAEKNALAGVTDKEVLKKKLKVLIPEMQKLQNMIYRGGKNRDEIQKWFDENPNAKIQKEKESDEQYQAFVENIQSGSQMSRLELLNLPEDHAKTVMNLYHAIDIYNDTRNEVKSDRQKMINGEVKRKEKDFLLAIAQGETGMETSYWENWRRRSGRGFDKLYMGPAALFGHEGAQDALLKYNKSAQYEKSYGWGEGDNWGAFGMVWADQGANMLMFVSTMGVGTSVFGLSKAGAMITPSVLVGTGSGGSKYVELTSLQEDAANAQLQLDALKLNYEKGNVTPKNFRNQKMRLNEVIDRGDMSQTQKWFSVISTGFIEMGFTYGYGRLGIGDIGIANKITKAFSKNTKGYRGLSSYNPWVGGKEALKGIGIQTGGEMLEEGSIYGATEFVDGIIFQRDGDYSQMSKVLWDAAAMSSSAGSVSITTNTMLNHNLKMEARRKMEEDIQTLKALESNIADIDEQILNIQLVAKDTDIEIDNNELARLKKERDIANQDLRDGMQELVINWQDMHVRLLGMSEGDQKQIYENSRLLSNYLLEAGILQENASNENHVNAKLEIYRNKLNKKKAGSGDAWIEGYRKLYNSNEDLKDAWTPEIATESIYGPDYKENGSRKEIKDIIQKDKSKEGKERKEAYNKADEIGKLRIELDVIQRLHLDNATLEMKQDEKVTTTVDNAVWSQKTYEINGVKYNSKKEFIDEIKRLNEEGEGGEIKIDVQNDHQASLLADNILHKNNETTFVSDGEVQTKPDEDVKVDKDVKVDEDVKKEKIKPNVTITNTTNTQTKQEWEQQNKGKKGVVEDRKQRLKKEQEIYDYLAKTHYAGGVRDLRTFENDKSTTKDIANIVEDATNRKLEFEETGSFDGLIDKVQELRREYKITAQEAIKMVRHLINNRKTIESNHNGFLLDNKFFVINEKQAKQRIKEDLDVTGENKFLQGAAWLHETGHYLDNITKSVEEISQKGIYLNEFLLNEKSERAQVLNENVENDLRRMSDGDGTYLGNNETIKDIIEERKTATGDRLDRIDKILDEYIREVTTKMKHENYAKLRNDVIKRGRGTFARFTNKDYKVKNAKEAAYEVVSFIEDFKKGRLTEAYKIQIEAAKGRKDLAGDVRGELQESTTVKGKTKQEVINNLVRDKEGSVITKKQYDDMLNKGADKVRRKVGGEWTVKTKPHPANLLTNDPSKPGFDELNGSIRNLGTRMEGDRVSFVKGESDSMSDFIQAVKDELTTAIINYNPETKYQGVAQGDLSGWLAQHIIYKKPGVIDKFKKQQEARAAAKQGGEYKGDGTLDVGTVEGTVVFARKLGFTEDVIGQDENGNDITRNAFDLIVEKKFNEVIAQDPKTYKDTKSLIKDNDAVLVEILNMVAKEFGVKPSKLIKDSALTTDERTSIQLKINSIGARSMLNMMPEAFNSLGDANGVQPVFLDGGKGKAINSETGETNLIYTAQEGRVKTTKQRIGNKIVYGTSKKKGGGKGLKIQKKNFVENINEADYLDMLGITPVGVKRRFRTEDRVVDGPLRGSVMQVAIIIANQSVTKIAEEKGLIGLQSMKDGKGDLMLSSIIDGSKQDLIQHVYWDGRNKFHSQFDNVILDPTNETNLKNQITKAFNETWPYGEVVNENGKDAWIGSDGVNYRNKLINWYSKTLRENYLKYTKEDVVMDGKDVNSFRDFLMAEDSKRDDGFDSISKILETDPITKLFRERLEINKKYQKTNADSYVTKLQEEGLTEEQAREKALGEYIRNKSFLENGTIDPARGMTFGDQKVLRLRNEESQSKYGKNFKELNKEQKKIIEKAIPGRHNEVYTQEFLTHIYPGLISYKKGPKVLDKNGKEVKDKVSYIIETKKEGKTIQKTIEVTKAWPQATTKDMLATTNEDGSIDSPMSIEEANARRKDSNEAMKFYDDITAIAAENSKAMKNGKEHFAMHMAAMNANMKTPLRRGAVFTYAALDAPATALKDVNGKKNFEFEHGLPAKVVNALMIGRHWFNNGLKLEDIQKAYEVGVLHRDFNDNVGRLFKERMHFNYQIGDGALKRWLSRWTATGASHALYNVFTGKVEGRQQAENHKRTKESIKEKTIDKAIQNSRLINDNAQSRGMSAFDFDETLIIEGENFIIAKKGKETIKISSEQWPIQGPELAEQGYEFDFTDFVNVRGGVEGPLMQKLRNRINKFGIENTYILTARPTESETAIRGWLKTKGIDMPLKNITGLGNSTGEAKALWMAQKYAEGYNDMYFVDDALPNVTAVKNIMDQLDIKGSSVQAKIQLSSDLNNTFNDILEETTGMKSEKRFSDAQAKLRGKGFKFRGLVPPSAQDFAGLLYNFIGKGKKGEQQFETLKKALIDPFARGYDELNTARQKTAEDYRSLLKEFPNVKKMLNKKAGDTGFTVDQAIRVYLWNKAGFDVPGLSKRDLNNLNSYIANDVDLQTFADALGIVSKKTEGYSKPGEYWLTENIASDLMSDGAIGDARANFLAEWQQNVDQIFSKENLNKIEVLYGRKFREALEDMLYRMKTGSNRPVGSNRLTNMYMNWVNNSVGAIMFFNIRSAVLQTISATNYINWGDNNVLKAGLAFANQKQYWKDFVMIFNSDMLKQRRAGLKYNINEAELAAAVAGSDNKVKAALAWLLKKGFTPTQIADSFAIASGGASFYRNRVKTYLKQGLDQKAAEEKAWLDFQETTEVAQQSARPDLISQQQANPLGRLILAFQNTPMQYGRIMNKAFRDLANGRGDAKTHVSKIIYYGALQGIIFTALQSALFAVLGSDDDDEKEKMLDSKTDRMANSMVDSWLSVFGYGGKAISTVKNTIMEFNKQRAKDLDDNFMTRSDHAYTLLQALSFSPPIGSKVRKIYQSTQTEKFNRDIISERGFAIDNPIWNAIGNTIEGVTNIPLGRLSNKLNNLSNAMDSRHETWQRVALLMGWNLWDLGVKDPDIVALGEDIKERKKQEKKIEKEKKKFKDTQEKLKEKYPDKTEEEVDKAIIIEEKTKEVFNLNKREQVKILEEYDLNPKDYPKEKDRVDKIMELYNKNPNKIDSSLTNIKNYVPSKQEKRSIDLFKMNKKDQVNLLMELGLSSKKIKELKYEEDRVNKIIQLENKKKGK